MGGHPTLCAAEAGYKRLRRTDVYLGWRVTIRRITEPMTLLLNDPLTQLAFSVHENKGVFAVLLGSGLSRSAQIPTGWEITLDLVRRVALAQGIDEQPDWTAWYREKTGQEPNYSVLL